MPFLIGALFGAALAPYVYAAMVWGFADLCIHAFARAYGLSIQQMCIFCGVAATGWYSWSAIIDAFRVPNGLTPVGNPAVYLEGLKKSGMVGLALYLMVLAAGDDATRAYRLVPIEPQQSPHVEIVPEGPHAHP